MLRPPTPPPTTKNKHAPAKSGSGPAGFSSFWPKKFIAGYVNSPAEVKYSGSSKEDGECTIKYVCGSNLRSWGGEGGSGEEDGGETGVSDSLFFGFVMIPTWIEGRPILPRRYTSTRYHRRRHGAPSKQHHENADSPPTNADTHENKLSRGTEVTGATKYRQQLVRNGRE